MKQFLYAFLMLLFTGFISCQDSKESVSTNTQQVTDRSDPYCCDSAGLHKNTQYWVVDIPCLSQDCCQSQECDFTKCSFPGNTVLENMVQDPTLHALTDCLNKAYLNCENKTVVDVGSSATSQWICLGDPLNTGCNYQDPYTFPILDASNGSTLTDAAFALCTTANALRAVAYTTANEKEVQCENENIIIEYAIFSRFNNCTGWPWEFPPFCYEVWIRFYCCND